MKRHVPPDAAVPLLRACLGRPDAWAALGDPRPALAMPDITRAGLMPQLLHAAEEAGVALDPAVRSALRTGRVYSELRLKELEPACRDGITGDVVVLRGLALAHTVYADPALRHCHDLDLLVPGAPGVSEHPSGLPISRHASLFSFRHVGLEDVETAPTVVGGVPARVLAPADALVHCCVHAATNGVVHGPLWCVDAGLLARDVDFDQVAERAGVWRVARQLRAPLSWLRDALGVPVPAALTRRRWLR